MHPPIAFLEPTPGVDPSVAVAPAAAAAPDALRPPAAEPVSPEQIALGLHALGAVKFGRFTLKSGALSPVYIDLRLLAGDPALLADAARAYAQVLRGLSFDRLAGIPLAGLPIATAVALEMGRPMVYPRPSVKQHGTGQTVEGPFVRGETAVVIDDLISSGLSKREAIAPLEAAGLKVKDVVVLIDRQGGGAEDLAGAGYRLHAVLTLSQVADTLKAAGHLDAATDAQLRRFLAGQPID